MKYNLFVLLQYWNKQAKVITNNKKINGYGIYY